MQEVYRLFPYGSLVRLHSALLLTFAVKVIIPTAYDSAESMAGADALGVAYYCPTKPFDLFHLNT